MTVMWYIIFMSSLFYMTVVLPFGLFYTETDEEKAFVSYFKIPDKLSRGASAQHSKMKSSCLL